MTNDPLNNSSDSPNAEYDPWDDQQISLQDIVLSNSWALQAILNYLEECDPNARERIWHHYETMKKQQDEVRRKRNGDHPDDSLQANSE